MAKSAVVESLQDLKNPRLTAAGHESHAPQHRGTGANELDLVRVKQCSLHQGDVPLKGRSVGSGMRGRGDDHLEGARLRELVGGGRRAPGPLSCQAVLSSVVAPSPRHIGSVDRTSDRRLPDPLGACGNRDAIRELIVASPTSRRRLTAPGRQPALIPRLTSRATADDDHCSAGLRFFP
jgi:hypothetical protein